MARALGPNCTLNLDRTAHKGKSCGTADEGIQEHRFARYELGIDTAFEVHAGMGALVLRSAACGFALEVPAARQVNFAVAGSSLRKT